MKRLVRSLVEVIQFVKTQPERGKKMLQEIYRLNDAAVIAKRYDAMVEMFPDYPYLTRGSVLSFLEILRDEGKLKDPLILSHFSIQACCRKWSGSEKNSWFSNSRN